MAPPRWAPFPGALSCSFSSQLGHSQPQRPTEGKQALSTTMQSSNGWFWLFRSAFEIPFLWTAEPLSAVHVNVDVLFVSSSEIYIFVSVIYLGFLTKAVIKIFYARTLILNMSLIYFKIVD